MPAISNKNKQHLPAISNKNKQHLPAVSNNNKQHNTCPLSQKEKKTQHLPAIQKKKKHLPAVSLHPVIFLQLLHPGQPPEELLVVGDEDELEVALSLPLIHDGVEGVDEGVDVLAVQVCGGLIQSQNTAVLREGFGESDSNEKRGQHFLSGGAPAPHVQFRIAFVHHNPVIVRTPLVNAFNLSLVSFNFNFVNVGALVRVLPELLDDLVDGPHLVPVEFHDGPVQGLVVFVQVITSEPIALDEEHFLSVLCNGISASGCSQIRFKTGNVPVNFHSPTFYPINVVINVANIMVEFALFFH